MYDETVLSTGVSNICLQCQNGYYIANNVCQEGTVENCEVYELTANVCSSCLNKYYLQDGKCNVHSSLSYCQNYSPTTPGICD